MAKRRRWEEELEREAESKPQLARKLADLDEGKRAGVLEELQRAGGNRALQQIVGGPQLQREAAEAGPIELQSNTPTMKIDGIPGPSKRRGGEGLFELEEQYELDVRTPTDPTTGQARGKRQYSEVKVVVRKSSAVTHIRRALAENKVIREIVITSPLEDGIERMALTKARVVGVKDLANGKVELRFVFDQVTWDAGDASASDKWYEEK